MRHHKERLGQLSLPLGKRFLCAKNFRIGIDLCSAPVRFYHNKVAKQYLFIVHIAVTQVKAYRGIV